MIKINLSMRTARYARSQDLSSSTRSVGLFATAGILSVLFAKAFLQLAFADDRPGNVPYAPGFGYDTASLGLFQVKDIQQKRSVYKGSLCVRHKEDGVWVEPSEECGQYVWAITNKDALALIKPTTDPKDKTSPVESFAFKEAICSREVRYESILNGKSLFETDFCRAYLVAKHSTKTSSQYVMTMGLHPSEAGAMVTSFATMAISGVPFGFSFVTQATVKRNKDGLPQTITLKKTNYGSMAFLINVEITDTYTLVRVGD